DSVTITGTAGPDSIAVSGLVITSSLTTVALAGVENLTVDAGAGDDTVTATGTSLAGNLTLTGGTDADSISAGNVAAAGMVLGAETVTVNGPISAGSGGVAVSGTDINVNQAV